MPRYLQKPCVDIRIVHLHISRDHEPVSNQWQTSVVLVGEAIDEDGKRLEDIHRKFELGSPGVDDWDADSFEADMQTLTAQVRAKYNSVLAEYTTS